MHNFVIIVDNEVVGNASYSTELEEQIDLSKIIAIYSSDPRFIPHHEGKVEEGYIWDGQNFNPPVE